MAKKCKTASVNINSKLRTLTANQPVEFVVMGENSIQEAARQQQLLPKDTLRIPMYGFFLNIDPNSSDFNAVKEANKKRYALSSVENMNKYLSNFEHLYFEATQDWDTPVSQDGKLYGQYQGKMRGFKMGDQGWIVTLRGDKNGKSNVIAILPTEKTPITKYFYDKWRQRIKGDGVTRLSLTPDQVISNLLPSNPITRPMVMDKKTVMAMNRELSIRKDAMPVEVKGKKKTDTKEQEKNEPEMDRYSIRSLKFLYGESYKYHFSQPYVLTDSRDRFRADHVGRPLVFYNVRPDGKRTVDDLIKAQMLGEEQLGVLYLDEGVMYKSVAELSDKFRGSNGQMFLPAFNNETRLFMGPWFSRMLYNYFMNKQTDLQDRFGQDFEEVVNMVSDGKSYNNHQDRENYISSQMLRFVLKAATKKGNMYYKSLIGDIDAMLNTRTEGVYVSPGIVYNYLQDISVAPIDMISDRYQEELELKLEFRNLAKDPVSVPNINLSLTEIGIDDIFSTKPASSLQHSTDIVQTGEKIMPGQVVKEDVQTLYKILSNYGITFDELSDVLHKNLLPLIQKSTNLDQDIKQLLSEYKC